VHDWHCLVILTMRASEWILLSFSIFLAAAAWVRPLTASRRWVTTTLAAVVICALAAVRLSEHILAPLHVSIVHDWLPVALGMVPYWQTGRFFTTPNEKIQRWLAEFDRRCLEHPGLAGGTLNPYIRLSLELAYMSSYPLIPLALAVLYATGLRRYADTFWVVVLVSTYICYAVTLFVPALPPRSVAGKQVIAETPDKVRVLNLWLLKHGSIQMISFPSAHVASSLAASLVIVRFVPAWGVVFLAVSIWIAVAAVAGGYHYLLDVLLGAATALIVFLVWVTAG
jgi:membrane-associated phospholipid phosphatase